MQGLKKITVFAITFLVILFSSGFSLNRMTCLISGYEEYSVSQITDCCEEEGKPSGPSFNNVCCDFDQFSFDIDILQIKKETQGFQIALPAVMGTLIPEVTVKSNHLLSLFIHGPPLPWGRDLLHLICTLTI